MIQPRVWGFMIGIGAIALFAGYMKITSAETLGEQPLVLPIIEVYDGDTIKTTIPLPAPLDRVSIRIYGIDTPEKGGRSSCDKERMMGKAATDFVKELAKVGNGQMFVTQYKWDKYGSRINGNVQIGDLDVAKSLLEIGLARPYFGVGPRPDWCHD